MKNKLHVLKEMFDLYKLLNFFKKRKEKYQFVRCFALFCWFLCLSYRFSLYSTPDLTVVGFLEPEGGIGKVPITIIETLGDKVSSNFVASNTQSLKHEIPHSVVKVLQNPDKSPGKVALLTDVLGHFHTRPYEHIPKGCIVKLAYSMLETTRIPNKWVKVLNEQFDAVIVPDPYLLDVYTNCGVKIPIFVLPMPMLLSPYFEHSVHPNSPSTPFIFGDASANKNPAVLLKAFAKAFGNNPDVHLVMRAGHIFDEPRETINRLINQYDLKNVTVEAGHLVVKEFIDRLLSFDCYINLSRGEGFSLIPREALALGIPVIITNNTASATICKSGYVRAIPCKNRGPANSGYQILFHEDCGEQFDCEVDDVAAALLDVYQHYEKYIRKARKGREWVKQYDTTSTKLQQSYVNLIKPKMVVMGDRNKIKDGVIITNSLNLYQKYLQIINQYR